MRWFFPMVSRVRAQANEAHGQARIRRKWRKSEVAAVLLIAFFVIGGAFAWGPVSEFIRVSQMPLEVSVAQGSDNVAPGQPIWIFAPTRGCNVTKIELFERPRAPSDLGSNQVVGWQDEQSIAMVMDSIVPTDAEWLQKLVLRTPDGTSPLRVDARYRVVVEGTRFRIKLPLPGWESWREEYSFQTLLSPVPVGLLPSYTMSAGETIPVRWSLPLEYASCRAEPSAGCQVQVDPSDPSLAQVSLSSYDQGASYRVTVTGARAVNGVDTAQTVAFKIMTPAALELASVTPEDGSYGFDPTQEIAINFSEPVIDKDMVQSAIDIDPPVPGHFEWTADGASVKFLPDAGLPWLTDIKVRVNGGTSLKSVSGGYLEGSPTWTFTTRPNKVLDVNLTRQSVTCLEGGNPVMTLLVATGVYRAETPTGTYMVLSKLPICRMKGVNPSGLAYDIPDVPWTMPFWGDYTIHGAYWRYRFGTPGSNGCISLSVPDAKRLYDWTPVGTRIQIHY